MSNIYETELNYNGLWVDDDNNIRNKNNVIVGHIDIVPVEEKEVQNDD